MRVGIFTFHYARNYGAVLQAYGLQECLRRLGHEACVVDYVPSYAAEPLFDADSWAGLPLPSRLRLAFRSLLTLPVMWRRKVAFARFVERRLRLRRLDLQQAGCGFDAFVFGSDQIWSASLTGGGDPVYWGAFPAARGRRLVAYAASAGSVDALAACRVPLGALDAFHAIGVRERSLCDYLKGIRPSWPVSLCLDPVLLAGRAAFEAIAEPIRTSKPYLLLFTLDHSDTASRLARRLAAERGWEVVELLTYTVALRSRQAVSVASPGQFVAYVRDAEYVVTSSFHGTAFSLLFHKEFCVACPDAARRVRMEDLLLSLGMEERVVDGGNAPSAPIDYAKVDARYGELRRQSERFLKKSLE